MASNLRSIQGYATFIMTKVIQGVKNIFDKVISWPQLISKLLVAPISLQCCF